MPERTRAEISVRANCNSPVRQRNRMYDRRHGGWRMILFSSVFLLTSQLCWPQPPQSVSIQVQFDQSEGPISPVWNYFGYDEPNYTYAPNGKKLLGELAAVNAKPVYVRVHNLLTTGDGSASLKWGSDYEPARTPEPRLVQPIRGAVSCRLERRCNWAHRSRNNSRLGGGPHRIGSRARGSLRYPELAARRKGKATADKALRAKKYWREMSSSGPVISRGHRTQRGLTNYVFSFPKTHGFAACPVFLPSV